MSEYPISCDKCGKYLGHVHATEYSNNFLCNDCWKEKYPNKEFQENYNAI